MYVIKTQRMCVYLQNKGFELKKSVRDRNNPKFFVYLFEDTNELRQALSEYKSFNK